MILFKAMSDNNERVTIDDFVRSYKGTSMLFINSMRGVLKNNSDLTPSLYGILKTLKKGGQLSQHDIAKELSCSDATISRQVFILQDMSYVDVKTNPDNRRVVVVSLTNNGTKALKELASMINAHLGKFLSNVPRKLLKDIIKNNLELHEILVADSKGTTNEK